MQVGAAEQKPFDGLVTFNFPAIKNGQQVGFDWEAFGSHRFERADLADSISTLSNINFQRFDDNFLRFNVSTNPGSGIDWFDNFDAALHNVGLWAEVAAETGMKGWTFDLEDYGDNLFNYQNLSLKGQKTFAQYAAQVRLRGNQVMQAIQQANPDIVLLLSLSTSYVHLQNPSGSNLHQMSYGLLPSFVDGLLEAAGPQVRIIDGQEQAYGYLAAADYLQGRKRILQDAQTLVAPELRAKYREKMEVGVGMFANYQLGEYFYPPTGWPTYYMTPQQRLESFERNVYWAMRTADDYVWMYSEGMSWWEEGYPIATPPGAEQAIRNARAKIERLTVPELLLSDHFDGASGTAMNASKWNAAAAPGVRADGNSSVVLDSETAPPPAGAFMIAHGGGAGAYGFEPTDMATAKMVALGALFDATGGVARIGLTTDGSGNTEVMMRSSFSYGYWYLRIADGNDEAIYLTDITRFSAGDWTIEWSEQGVTVLYNGDVKIDTSIDAPDAVSGAGLNCPDVSLVPDAGTGAGGVIRIDSLAWGAFLDDDAIVTPGDADFDGDVDMRDLSKLAAHFGIGANAAWMMGDFDGDGDVDLSDLTRLATNYNGGQAQAMADFRDLVAVPEPSIALAFGALLACRCGRRTRSFR